MDLQTVNKSVKMFLCTLYKSIKTILAISGIYIIWIILHYISSHLYIYWCVPGTILGFIIAPFIVPAPHCQALRWAIYNGGNTIIAMWLLLGAWISKYLINF